jgi:hypothetical protein
MTPDLYAIQYASTPAEVIALLQRCVAYVRKGPVLALLPDELQGLTVRDEADVTPWRLRLEQVQRRPAVLSASARCWVEELTETFRMASRRLIQLEASRTDSATAVATAGAVQPIPEQHLH